MTTVDSQQRERIRDRLLADPHQVQVLGDNAKFVREEAMATFPPNALQTICFDFGIDQLRQNLLSDNRCELEALAVDQVISHYIQIGTATHHMKSCVGRNRFFGFIVDNTFIIFKNNFAIFRN